MSLRESVLPGRTGEMNLISKASTVHVFEIINRTKLIPISPQLDSWYHLYQNTPETIYASNGILQTSNKKSLPNVELSSDTWRRRWDSNPRDIAVKLISSQSRYDRFDTSAYLVFIAPPRTAFGKMRDFDAR